MVQRATGTQLREWQPSGASQVTKVVFLVDIRYHYQAFRLP